MLQVEDRLGKKASSFFLFVAASDNFLVTPFFSSSSFSFMVFAQPCPPAILSCSHTPLLPFSSLVRLTHFLPLLVFVLSCVISLSLSSPSCSSSSLAFFIFVFFALFSYFIVFLFVSSFIFFAHLSGCLLSLPFSYVVLFPFSFSSFISLSPSSFFLIYFPSS